jgi:hypothetical protein
MVRVAPWWTVRLACRYGCVRVPTRRSPSCRTGMADWVTVRLCPPARRGYGCRLSMPVVEGTGVDPVQVCQGSYAPPSASVAGTANRVTVRLCAGAPGA